MSVPPAPVATGMNGMQQILVPISVRGHPMFHPARKDIDIPGQPAIKIHGMQDLQDKLLSVKDHNPDIHVREIQRHKQDPLKRRLIPLQHTDNLNRARNILHRGGNQPDLPTITMQAVQAGIIHPRRGMSANGLLLPIIITADNISHLQTVEPEVPAHLPGVIPLLPIRPHPVLPQVIQHRATHPLQDHPVEAAQETPVAHREAEVQEAGGEGNFSGHYLTDAI